MKTPKLALNSTDNLFALAHKSAGKLLLALLLVAFASASLAQDDGSQFADEEYVAEPDDSANKGEGEVSMPSKYEDVSEPSDEEQLEEDDQL
jgi:hypothetical protein